MPTGCQNTNFSELAKAVGYKWTTRISTLEELKNVLRSISNRQGPVLLEILVSLESREDLGRPRESARNNKESFMDWMTTK